ncbi:MAG: cytochrome c-type biogenesis protein [Alphaproteobacteria bacterium]
MGSLLRFLLTVFFLTTEVLALEPGEILKDPALEARARSISKNLRCLVCQNQSIDDSDAALAKDLRIMVRNQILSGKSNEQIISDIVARYGDFVLLKPPINQKTLILWFSPVLILLAGGMSIYIYFRKRKSAAAETLLSDAEKEKLAEIWKGNRS